MPSPNVFLIYYKALCNASLISYYAALLEKRRSKLRTQRDYIAARPWTEIMPATGVCLCVRCRVGVSVWELSATVLLESAYFSIPPHKCFTVTTPQQGYKVFFCVAHVHLGRPSHLQPGINTAQLWTIPNTHTYSCVSELFTMSSSSPALSPTRSLSAQL